MSQVMLNRVKVDLTSDQIIAALRQMPQRERARVRRELDTELWQREFKALLAKFQARAEKYPLTEAEIIEEVRHVRTGRRNQQLGKGSH